MKLTSQFEKTSTRIRCTLANIQNVCNFLDQLGLRNSTGLTPGGYFERLSPVAEYVWINIQTETFNSTPSYSITKTNSWARGFNDWPTLRNALKVEYSAPAAVPASACCGDTVKNASCAIIECKSCDERNLVLDFLRGNGYTVTTGAKNRGFCGYPNVFVTADKNVDTVAPTGESASQRITINNALSNLSQLKTTLSKLRKKLPDCPGVFGWVFIRYDAINRKIVMRKALSWTEVTMSASVLEEMFAAYEDFRGDPDIDSVTFNNGFSISMDQLYKLVDWIDEADSYYS